MGARRNSNAEYDSTPDSSRALLAALQRKSKVCMVAISSSAPTISSHHAERGTAVSPETPYGHGAVVY